MGINNKKLFVVTVEIEVLVLAEDENAAKKTSCRTTSYPRRHNL